MYPGTCTAAVMHDCGDDGDAGDAGDASDYSGSSGGADYVVCCVSYSGDGRYSYGVSIGCSLVVYVHKDWVSGDG